jgi:hypothetical protein
MAETAPEVREQAQEKAKDAASKASDKIRSQVDQRSTEAGERIAGTAGDIRSVGQQLRDQGKEQPAKIADQTAQRVERVGQWMRDSDSDRILQDVEDFGRRRPWALALGGLALGFAASRFLKASSTQRYHQRQQFMTGAHGTQPGNGHEPSLGIPAARVPERAPVATPSRPTPAGGTPAARTPERTVTDG